MRRVAFNPWAGLFLNSQFLYWLTLIAFAVLIVVSFLLFETKINSTLSALNNNLQEHSLSLATVIFLLIGLLAFDVLLPIPSSLVSVLAVTTLGAVTGSLVIFIGLCLGAILGYVLGTGWFYGRTKFVTLRENQPGKTFSTTFTTSALILFRGVPVLAETSVIAAGMSNYPLKQFLLVTTLANFGLAVAYGYIGSTLTGS